ncbi:MAG: galactose-1-phosphate uridylyltransferase [Candidatus Schekmanbacteria bacterium]|nr:galactose-1-phosphate uridylyltransferase [Candidatus Schekmanbacteria bacterium]
MYELRKDPALGAWVILTPKVTAEEPIAEVGAGRCRFCPGNEALTAPESFALREPNTAANGPGWWARTFPLPAPLLSPENEVQRRGIGMYDWASGVGAHEILVETPQHDVDVADLTVPQIREILWAYRARLAALKEDGRFRYAMIIKNHVPTDDPESHHAHSHVLATPITPKRIKEEYVQCKEYYRRKERCLYCDIIFNEVHLERRVVEQNKRFVAICPYASRFPYELTLLPLQHSSCFDTVDSEDISDLAAILKKVLLRLRAALGECGYAWVLHSGPNRQSKRSPDYWRTIELDYHWHIELVPVGAASAGRPGGRGERRQWWPSHGFDWGLDLFVCGVKPEEAAEHLRSVRGDEPR